MNIDLVLKRLELIKEGKGVGTISDVEASIILKEIERLKGELQDTKEHLGEYLYEQEEENKELKQKVKYYENFEINKTVDKIRLENNKREKELQNKLQQKENIINELDTFLKNKIDNFKEDVKDTILHEQITISIIYNYLQELKGDKNNGNNI